MKGKTKLLAVLATSSLLLTPVFAQERENREGRGGNRENRPRENSPENRENRGNRNPDTKPEPETSRTNGNDDWERNYHGAISIALTDDRDYSQALSQENSLETLVKSLQTQASSLQSELDTVVDQKTKLDNEINTLNDKIQSSIVKQQQLETAIPRKEQQVKDAEVALQLAKKALDGYQKDQKNTEDSIAAESQKLKDLEASCLAAESDACRAQIEVLKAGLARLNDTLASQKPLTAAAEESRKKASNQLNKQKEDLASSQQELVTLKAQNVQSVAEVETKKAQRAPLIGQIETKRTALDPVSKSLARERANLEQKRNEVQGMRKLLIAKILEFNSYGFDTGKQHGRQDGSELALKIGTEDGRRDGEAEGSQLGIRDGMLRVYREGSAQGRVEGADQARVEGEQNGTRDGTAQGNIDAGRVKGEADGQDRANKSDAASVGTDQGDESGMELAVRDGNNRGTKTGEAQAIQKYEGTEPAAVSAFGAFAGSFQSRSPEFPRTFNRGRGHNTNPGRRASHQMFEKAYRDGYDKGYNQAVRNTFEREVGAIYNQEYQLSVKEAYDYHQTREYPQKREEGLRDGRKEGYSLAYPGEYKRHYDDKHVQFALVPNTASAEYTGSYRNTEAAAYARVYEKIRAANFKAAQSETYDKNIQAQTEIYRAKRFAEVSETYETKPVLKFVDSSSVDGGISEVAKLDGVFQPGETVFHSLTIINFGKKPATGAVVSLEDGSSFAIEAIAPQSKTTIKGIARGSISPQAKIGSSVPEALAVKFALTGEAAIQGRHFVSRTGGLVGLRKSAYPVAYPISLSNLRPSSQLLINQSNKLLVTAKNNSSRPYSGDLKISITDDASSKIITKEFSSLKELSSSQTLSDAEILVSDKRDAYRSINLRATISQNGVKIGELTPSAELMAKSAYQAGGDELPVIVVDSDSASRQLLDVMDKLGGSEKVSILDLSLSDLNRDVLSNGVVNKSLIVVDDGNGSSVRRAEATLAKSTGSSMLFVDDNNRALGEAKRLSMFANAANFPVRISGLDSVDVSFTNSYKTTVNRSVQPAIGSDLSNMLDKVKLLELLRIDGASHLQKIGATLTGSNYFNPSVSQAQLAEAFNVKMMGELMAIDLTYRLSNKKDKNMIEQIKRNRGLLLNQLLAAVDVPVSEQNLGLHLFAVNAVYTLDKAMNDYVSYKDFSDKGEDLVDDISKDIEKKFKGKLKSTYRPLHDQVYRTQNVYTPFLVRN